MATASIYSASDSKTSWGAWTKYFSFPISTINSALNNTSNVPANAKITGVIINVSVRYEVSGGANVYFKYGIGGNGSISNELLSENQIGSTGFTGSETQSKTLPMSSVLSPFAVSTANGSYFTICIYTSNRLPKTFWVDSVTLTINYTIPTYTISTAVSPANSGSVSGGGVYEGGASAKLIATANTGYEFQYWQDDPNNTSRERTVTVTGNASYTAVFKAITRTITVKAGEGCSYISLYGGDVINAGETKSWELLYSSQFTLYSFPQEGYVFDHWKPSGDTRQHLPVTLTEDMSVEAVFKLGSHTVKFNNFDGTTLKTETLLYGSKPTPPADPVKPDTAQHKYTFDGWYDGNGNKWTSSTTIAGDTTYTARYTSTVQKYTVRWYNYDGTLLETDDDVPYGTKPTYNGATPTKPSDDYYNYGFAGWSPSADGIIEGDKDFTAQFAQTDRYYTVRWVNASAVQGVEGALLETDEVKFNTQPDYNGATPKHPKQDTDPALNYDFIGWSAKVTDPAKPDTELEKVKGNITYTAIYETTPKLYAITVILFDGKPNTDIYEYGTEVPIEAPETVDFHRFVKWSDGNTQNSRKITVIGVATYQAIYEKIPIPIKVNLEQVTGCYIVPDASNTDTGTIIYVINGTVPTVEIGAKGDMQTVDGWSFFVSNTIPANGFPLNKLFITDKSGITARIY